MSDRKRGSLDVKGQPESGARSTESPDPQKAAPRNSPVRSQGVAQAARDRLAGSSYPALRPLRCSFHEGVLTLRGRVPSYHMRQVAWKLVSDLPGVEEFVDRLEVVEDPDPDY